MFDGFGGSPNVLERANGKLRLCANSSSNPPLFVSCRERSGLREHYLDGDGIIFMLCRHGVLAAEGSA